MPSRRAALIAVSGVLAGLLVPLLAGPAHAAPSATGEFNYAEALQDSMLFYESQRSGALPADNRVLWRGNSDLTDGADHNVDLTGGYHDAGDEIKFGFPEAYSMTTLAWGGLADKAGYVSSGQWQFLERNLRWGDDYIIKAHPSPHVFYGQVGDATDHNFWGPAEVNPSARPSFAVTESCPGSDLTGEAAAALAASSMVFQTDDPTYSATLLSQAKSLYEFADDFRGTYDACITAASNFYHSFSGYWDELVWGAIWLYKATGDTTYLTKAENYYPNLPFAQQTTNHEFAWTINWDDKSYGDYVLLAEITGQQQYITDAERNLDWFTSGSVNGAHVNMSPGGEAQVDVWGTARYASNASFLALEFAHFLKAQGTDPTRQQAYHDFAVRQINYVLGDNPNHESYEVGFTNSGTNTAWPQNIHNRTAHDSWDQSMSDPTNTRHLDYGLLVGGPTSGDGFMDQRSNFQQTEGALDYNSLFSGDLAELTQEFGGTVRANFPPTEQPTGAEMFMQAAPNTSSTNFIEIKAEVVNESGWPARALTNGSFRYYFTLDPGETPSQLALSSPFNQCTNPSGVTQFSGAVYYVTVSCAGQNIAPAGQSAFHREVQFRITFPAAHDFTKDWSYQDLAGMANGATPVTTSHIELYNGTTKVWGTGPSPTSSGTPPAAPTGLTASGVTQNSATLSWTASVAGSNPVAGYDVFSVAGGVSTKLASTTSTSVVLTGLSPGTAYTLDVVARDASGNTSPPSATVSVTTQGTPPPPPPPGGGVKAQYKDNDTTVNDIQIKPGLNLVNTGTSAVALNTVTVRYWFTADGGASTFTTNCDYAVVGCGTITQQIVTMATPVTGADHYLQVGFTTGSLAAGASTGDIQNRFNKTDWSAFNQANDYSFGTGTTYADATTVTVYVNGTLVWGTEPH